MINKEKLILEIEILKEEEVKNGIFIDNISLLDLSEILNKLENEQAMRQNDVQY